MSRQHPSRLVWLLTRNTRGAAILEFALIAPVFLLLLLGVFDFGQGIYIKGVLQGAVQAAGRNGGLENGSNQIDLIDEQVRSQVKPVAPKGAILTTRKNYKNFLQVGKPEDFTDSNNNNAYDSDECFIDVNGNTTWDADRSQSGQGGADDVVVYTAALTYKRIVPIWRMMGWSENNTVSATTILRNQPYGDQAVRPEVQICPA